MWAEDNPALVLSELTLQETGEEWRQRKNALLSKSLAKLPIPELKKVWHDFFSVTCSFALFSRRFRQCVVFRFPVVVRRGANAFPRNMYSSPSGRCNGRDGATYGTDVFPREDFGSEPA